MKKFIIGSILLLSSINAHAGIVTLSTISADALISGVNQNFTILADANNGQVQGSATTGSTTNILADSIGELDMGDEANPRVRDSELFNITTDTISGGVVASQGTVVESGCVQATDSDLTADVSACTVYINGYRVVKAATAQTYANNTTTYLWISQTGSYTQSTNPNTTVSNSALLANVTTSGGAITAVSNLFTTRVPGLVIPPNYRSGLVVSRDSTSTITVFPGTVEINNSMLTKTSTTTLNLATAGDYAGGSSLRATSTYGYVGMDASGNLKMHTTAPTHTNYAVSVTAGKKRYATWSSTVYRILGWFYMNATGSGELNTYEVGNIKEGDVSNSTVFQETNTFNTSSATFVADTNAVQRFYSSGGPLEIKYSIASGSSAAVAGAQVSIDGAGIPAFERSSLAGAATDWDEVTVNYMNTVAQGPHTIQGYIRGHGGASVTNKAHGIIIDEK